MVVAKRKSKKRSKDLVYHKYLDFRAIIPAVIIAFIASIATTFFFMDYFVIGFEENIISVFAIPAAVAAGVVFTLVSKILFFTMEFFAVFIAVYFVLWVVFHEQDKKLYMEYKKKGLLKKNE